MFPSTEYAKWIKFRDKKIYEFVVNVYSNTVPGPYSPEDIEDYKSFIESIWTNATQINNGMNNDVLNYLLFTHLLVINSEIILPDVYLEYDMNNKMASPLTIVSSTSDGSTSVSSSLMGVDNLGLDSSMYLLTKWGYMYLSLLQQIQNMIVIL